MPGAVVIGGAQVSIAIARSLGRRGVRVWLLANHPLPTYSRYVERSFSWPGADHPQSISSIIDLAKAHGLQGWVLITTGDQDMRMVAMNHTLLARAFSCADTPDWETMRWAYDKRLTYERAKLLGIDYPENFALGNLADVEKVACRFPVVLKLAFRQGADEFTLAKAWKAENRDELRSLYRRASTLIGNDAVMVQEWIPGGGEEQYSYAALCERGKPIASMVARRRRQHPIDFGRSSTFVESIEQPEVEELARRFLKSIAYTGVAEVNSNTTAAASGTSCSTSMDASGPGTDWGCWQASIFPISPSAKPLAKPSSRCERGAVSPGCISSPMWWPLVRKYAPAV
jgi:D-aspartate ligase